MPKWFVRGVAGCLVVVCCLSGAATIAHAQTLQSENYQFSESSIGLGGLNQASSENFQSKSSLGDLTVGNTASEDGVQVETGSQTTNDPTLSFALENPDASFGSFSAAEPATATAKFSVINYTSYGYVVQVTGDPPSNGEHTIDAMAETGTSQTGIEQFGINLVANVAPVSVGANPFNGDFGFGEAAPSYGTSGEYRYVSGETIALAPKSSGKTIYTISYLVNVGSLTPGGKYTSDQTLIVTGTY